MKLNKHKGKIKKINIKRYIEKSKVIKSLSPKEENYRKTQQNLKKLNIGTSIEMMVFFKILVILFSFSVYLMFSRYLILQKEKEIINGVNRNRNVYGATITNEKSVIEQKILIKTIESVPYKELIRNNELQQLHNDIKKIENEELVEDIDNSISKKVMQSLIEIFNLKIGISNIIIGFLGSLLFSNVINLYIRLRINFFEAKVESEICLMEMLTFILIKSNNVSVEEILKKQRDYSKLLKPYYNKCLEMYPNDQIKALNLLKQSIDNSDFSKFIFLIEKNLTTDRDTNLKLIEANKNLRHELMEEREKKKHDKKSIYLTLVSLPVLLLCYAILFGPIIYYVKSMM